MAEALEKLIRKGKAGKIVAFFAGMNEKERRALAPMAIAAVRESTEFGETKSGGYGFTSDDSVRAAANLAALATASPAELKKLGWRSTPPFWDPERQEQWLAVLRDRAPGWIDDWAEWLLQENHRVWRFVRRMERAGLCRPSDSDAYVLGMIEGVMPQRDGASILDGLLEEPELLDGPFWRLFEVEGGGEVSLANFEKFGGSGGNGWADAMRELSARGTLDRGRLLDASLEALARDFSQYRAGWFSRFHEFMEPTPDERAARADRYLDLLASPIPPTVAFAMKALAALHKAKRLDGAAFVARAEPALYAKAKGTVKQGLRLLAAFAKADGALAPEICLTATAALEHTEPEVQEAALALIESFGDPADGTLLTAIEDRREIIAASLRGRVSQWLGATAPNDSPARPIEDLSELITRAGTLPEDFARTAGVDLALAEFEKLSGTLGCAAYDGSTIPRLSHNQRILPVETLEELVPLCLKALDMPGDTEQVEQAMDGIMRLCDLRPDDFEARTRPLRKKVAKIRQRLDTFLPYWAKPDGSLLLLIEAWLEDRRPDTGTADNGAPFMNYRVEWEQFGKKHVRVTRSYVESLGIDAVFFLRAVHAAERVTTGQAAPLLSLPTHRGSWISANTLVERSLSWPSRAGDVSTADQVLALLRLAPEGRPEALKMASGLAGEWGAALRHALGGNEAVGDSAALWTAAARARSTFGDDEKVAAAFPALGPDAGGAKGLDYRFQIKKWNWDGKVYTHHKLRITCVPEAPYPRTRESGKEWTFETPGASAAVWPLLPTVLALRDGPDGAYENEPYFWSGFPSVWAPALWPANPDTLYARALEDIHEHIDSPRPSSEPTPTALSLLLDPDQPLTRMGKAMLAPALGAQDAAEGQQATDVLLAVLEDGRLDSESLAAEMRLFLAPGAIKPKRWAARLREAAGESPLHAQAVRQVLERLVDLGTAEPPRDIHALMELLHELCVETGEPVTDPRTRDYLAGIKGGGKAAKLAKTLLALQETDPLPHRRAAAALALTGRVERAERWAARR